MTIPELFAIAPPAVKTWIIENNWQGQEVQDISIDAEMLEEPTQDGWRHFRQGNITLTLIFKDGSSHSKAFSQAEWLALPTPS